MILGDDASKVLADFGLAYTVSLGSTAGEQSVDSAIYLSPEQAGSLDYDVSEASDLYAAGVVLFESLAGRPPFTGDSVGDVLLQHMTARVPDLRGLGLEIPRTLDELIRRLLRKE